MDLPLVGLDVGVSIYPGTPFAEELGFVVMKNPLKPEVYYSPDMGDDPVGFVRKCMGNEPRCLLLASAGEKGSYNYAGNDTLSLAIKNGFKGAYWDIIRQMGKS
jgi:hypothetical protein